MRVTCSITHAIFLRNAYLWLDWWRIIGSVHGTADTAHVALKDLCWSVCAVHVGPSRIPALYIVHGVLIMDPPLIVMSALAVTQSLIILGLVHRYRVVEESNA